MGALEKFRLDLHFKWTVAFMPFSAQEAGAMLKGLITFTGIIDSDYRGELSAVVFNAANSDRLIAKGDRISQLKFAVTLQHGFKQVDELDATMRGDKGFGSTGERG